MLSYHMLMFIGTCTKIIGNKQIQVGVGRGGGVPPPLVCSYVFDYHVLILSYEHIGKSTN